MSEAAKTPLHLWIVGALSGLWNLFGAYDYIMTQTSNAQYLASFTDAQKAYFASFPAWMEAAWAVGVWGALAGSLLLLLRNRHAVSAFGLSLLGLLVSTLWQFGLAPVKANDIMPPEGMYLTAAIWAVAVGLVAYAIWARRRGWLR